MNLSVLENKQRIVVYQIQEKKKFFEWKQKIDSHQCIWLHTRFVHQIYKYGIKRQKLHF